MQKESMAACGCLLIHDLTARQTQVEQLCHSLENKGYPVNVADLFGFVAVDEFDRTPQWQRWLTQAQEAYLELRRVCEKVVVLGVGYGSALANVLAEQYSVDGLIVLGSVLRRQNFISSIKHKLPFVSVSGAGKSVSANSATKIIQLSKNNLFSVVADTLVMQPMDDDEFSSRGMDVLLNGIRSKTKDGIELNGAKLMDMCSTHFAQIDREVVKFLESVV